MFDEKGHNCSVFIEEYMRIKGNNILKNANYLFIIAEFEVL
jgi:hypothetical protein